MSGQPWTATRTLVEIYGDHSFQTSDNPEDGIYKKLPQRLASLLGELADPETGLIERVQHQALADDLGTDRFTVSAILRDFKQNQFISLGYRRIQILQGEAMRELV